MHMNNATHSRGQIISLSKDRVEKINKYDLTCPVGVDYVLEYPYLGRRSGFSPQASGIQILIPKKEDNDRAHIYI